MTAFILSHVYQSDSLNGILCDTNTHDSNEVHTLLLSLSNMPCLNESQWLSYKIILLIRNSHMVLFPIKILLAVCVLCVRELVNLCRCKCRLKLLAVLLFLFCIMETRI